MNTSFPWLSFFTAIPVIGAIITLLAGRRRNSARWIAVVFGAISLVGVLCLWHGFDASSGALQFEERHVWVPVLNIEYRLAIDGLGLLMLLLSAIVTLLGMGASWKISDRVPLYYALVLLLEACLFGAFTALNFVHWFTFWELSLVPAFFLIKLWGGTRRSTAATQFLVYTMVGSVAMLLTFLALYLGTGQFDFTALAQLAQSGSLMPQTFAALHIQHFTLHGFGMLLFAGAFLGFAVKVPIMPFHTWLPEAYSEAPSGTTALLTGAMSKMGLYGFLRVLLPIFGVQMQSAHTLLLWMAAITIVSSGFAALAQKDLKRIFAYSSINHLAYCLLAIFAVAGAGGLNPANVAQQQAALSGVLFQMFNHGLTAATIFWFIALIESRSDGLRGLRDFGGLRKVAPVFAGLMGIALFSSLGLPGLNGFVGEFLIFRGSFPLAIAATSVAVLGLLLTAMFILNVIQHVFAGPLAPQWSSFPDLSRNERMALAPAIALMFLLGLVPQLILGPLHGTIIAMVQQLKF
ncbi:NADH dehydrogenase subunit M [Bryocella elongata]|uniref:NADH dehydrogenase subunit M n=1 Tax=Bryocella elongata TaxID=863522 RepID=A0A1H5VVB9_9BACT|nr:NADH-quinone oxidoreductase subunit M [Bryocella elongata]SEF91212.1 NADH dehydrogenase subunit M [Bryocella elongata]